MKCMKKVAPPRQRLETECIASGSPGPQRGRVGRTETRNFSFLPRASAEHMVIASAAAVASSSSEALEISMPVRSVTTVWKLSRLSSRPCAISACARGRVLLQKTWVF